MRLSITYAIVGTLACGCINVNVKAPAGLVGTGKSAGPAKTGGWKDVAVQAAGGIFLDAQEGIVFYASDALGYPNEPVELSARLQSAKDFSGIEGLAVGFRLDGERLGQACTDKDGYARLSWIPPAQGDYEISAGVEDVPPDELKVLMELEPAWLHIACRAKGTPFVVIDLDHTLVDSSFFHVLVSRAEAAEDSVRVVEAISRQYSLIYLTQRPDVLTRKTKAWLKQNGYHKAPLLVGRLKDVFDSGAFKTSALLSLKQTYPNIKIGIGDKISDAQAYSRAGMTAYLLPFYKDNPEDMRELARQIQNLNRLKGLQVVSDWRQIEQGIFQGNRFPPQQFVKKLIQQAGELEAQRHKDDSGDDEDD